MNKLTFGFEFFKRFLKLLDIVFPTICCICTLLFFIMLGIVILEQYLTYKVGLIPSQYYTILGEKNFDEFLKCTGIATCFIISISMVLSIKKYVSMLFYIKCRELTTKCLHDIYMNNNCFYNLNILDTTVDNVDQRITQDVDKMWSIFGEIIPDLIISPFTIIYYTYKTYTSSGIIGPITVYAYFLISTIINKFLMSSVVDLVAKQEMMEGTFRYRHTETKSSCESIALLNAGPYTKKILNNGLDSLILSQIKLVKNQFPLNLSVNLANYIGSILSYVIISIPIFSGVYDDKSATELSSIISQSSFFTMYLIYSFSRLISMAMSVSTMSGCAHRIGQLYENMMFLKSNSNHFRVYNYFTTQTENSTLETKFLNISNLTVKVPNSTDVLIRDLTISFNLGQNVMISGASGIGKTSLIRSISGLWNNYNGKIELLINPKEIFILPQKPYISVGNLRNQINCPDLENKDKISDEKIYEYINMLELNNLYLKLGGLDADVTWDNWMNILSPGEMQRLSFLRLFYHRPLIAILDEATSQVSISMEEMLYKECERLKITLITVGHRQTLIPYHHRNLRIIDTDGHWEVGKIGEAE